MFTSGYITRFQSNSFIARIDARVKLVMILSVLILVFVWNNPIYLGFLVLTIIVLSLLGGIPWSYLWKLDLNRSPIWVDPCPHPRFSKHLVRHHPAPRSFSRMDAHPGRSFYPLS